MMHRASAYKRSQQTLTEFAEKFNAITAVFPNLRCCPIVEETMLNDGYFIDASTGTRFAFDWQIRETVQSFKPGEFPYSTLTEFERKFSSDKNTQLFIQSDNQEIYIAVAWREDFKASSIRKHAVKADYGKQQAERRETAFFHVYELNHLEEFKMMLHRAIAASQYNHNAF